MNPCHEKYQKRHNSGALKAAVFLFLLFAAAVSVADVPAFRRPVHIAGGHAWGFQVTAKMLRAFCEERGVPEESFAVERWADHDSDTAPEEENIYGETNFSGHFGADEEGFSCYDYGQYFQYGANQGQKTIGVLGFFTTYQPEIEEDGLNVVTVDYLGCRKWWGGGTSTRDVSDLYEFHTAAQVQSIAEEEGGTLLWKGDVNYSYKEVHVGEDAEYGPYEVEFLVDLEPGISATQLAVEGFVIGTTITVAGSTGVISAFPAAVLGITVGAVYTIAGIVHSEIYQDYQEVDQIITTESIMVQDGMIPRLRVGVKARYYFRRADVYPDGNKNGLADGEIVETAFGHWRDFQNSAVIDQVSSIPNDQ